MKMSVFLERLQRVLDEKNIKAVDIANATGISNATISKYLSDDKKKPAFEYVLKIAEYINEDPRWLGGFSDSRKPFREPELTPVYNRLSPIGKKEVMDFAAFLLARENAQPQLEEDLTTYNIPMLGRTAAGTAIGYGDPIYETVSIKDMPKNADFALVVRGDSMEPLIKDASFVFVKSQPTIENGEIGIIDIDGEVTCKKVYYVDGLLELRSINAKYKPIRPLQARIIGKVII
jgi:repressor LexA